MSYVIHEFMTTILNHDFRFDVYFTKKKNEVKIKSFSEMSSDVMSINRGPLLLISHSNWLLNLTLLIHKSASLVMNCTEWSNEGALLVGHMTCIRVFKTNIFVVLNWPWLIGCTVKWPSTVTIASIRCYTVTTCRLAGFFRGLPTLPF